jgi:hypothetical protein
VIIPVLKEKQTKSQFENFLSNGALQNVLDFPNSSNLFVSDGKQDKSLVRTKNK